MSAFAPKIFLLQHCFVSLRRFDSIAHPKFQDAKLSGNSGLFFFTTGVLNCKHFRNKRVHLWKLIATKQGMFMVSHHVTDGRIPLTPVTYQIAGFVAYRRLTNWEKMKQVILVYFDHNFTTAHKFWSNCLFQLDNGFYEYWSYGGTFNNVNRDWWCQDDMLITAS